MPEPLPNPGMIVINRVLDAPRELVFDCWLKPEHLVHWFRGSSDWHTPYAETDPRAGGTFRIGFGSPDGKNDFDFYGTYDEVVPPERIVFHLGDGRPVTVSIVEQFGKTLVTVEFAMEETNSAEQQREGWNNMLVHLDQYLASR